MKLVVKLQTLFCDHNIHFYNFPYPTKLRPKQLVQSHGEIKVRKSLVPIYFIRQWNFQIPLKKSDSCSHGVFLYTLVKVKTRAGCHGSPNRRQRSSRQMSGRPTPILLYHQINNSLISMKIFTLHILFV